VKQQLKEEPLGEADRTLCARGLANVNVVTFLLTYVTNNNFRHLPQILALQIVENRCR